jgi:hypothetical protein
MLDSMQIRYGSDFKLVDMDAWSSLSVLKNNTVVKHTFEKITTVLFIRFTQIHPLYMELHRKQHGSNGVDLTSIQHYISTNKAYLGLSTSTRFSNGINTSAYAFEYNQLSINLKRDGQINEDLPPLGEILPY